MVGFGLGNNFFDFRYECSLSTADLVVFVGPGPFFVAGSAGVCFRTKRKSGWGFCGSSWAGCGVFCFDSAFGGLLQVHGHSAMYLFRFYHFYFCQDRASGDIGHTGRKKKLTLSRK